MEKDSLGTLLKQKKKIDRNKSDTKFTGGKKMEADVLFGLSVA